MAIAKWNTPSTASANILGTTANSLANGSASAFVTYDNSTNLDLYASIALNLGSITPTTGGAISIAIFAASTAIVPDNTAALGGGDVYTAILTVTASAKIVTFPMVRLYPESLRISVINSAGVALAASANTLVVRPFNESVT